MRALTGGKRLVVGALLAGLFVRPARAGGPVDPAIDVQLFDYAVGPKSFMTVTDAQVSAAKQYSFDFLLTFLTDPFVVYNFDEGSGTLTGQRTAVVHDLLAGELGAAYGLSDRLQLGVSLPLTFSLQGEGLVPGSATQMAGGLKATGVGDLLLEGKYALWHNAMLSLAATGGLTIPTSVGTDGGDYLGDNLPTARARIAAQWQGLGGQLSFGANLGAILRKPRMIYGTEVGQQVTYGAAGAFRVLDSLAVIGELFGRGAIKSPDLNSSPLEASGGLRLQASSSISVLAGGGAGLVSGIGSPGFRLFLSVGYAPDLRDSDHDGIPNLRDSCPLVPEDKDGFEDSDGCPDLDNDGDHRPDSEDKCPNEAEDIDGFDDDDGCPELDNDKDGIADLTDKCPNDAEDGAQPYPHDGCPAGKRDSDDDGIADNLDACPEDAEDDDGFEDWDGCPEDDDKDGVPDDVDQCRTCPEDKDGVEDKDGCPDFDNDGDGVVDAQDKCPNEAETINGIQDTDGCPDTGGAQLADLDGNMFTFTAPIKFSGSDKLSSAIVVDQVALVINQNADVTKWRVVVAAAKQKSDGDTRAKSQRQADAIKAELVARGVASDFVEAIGAVSDKPTIAIAVIERGDTSEGASRDWMCPAALRAVPRPAPPAATPTASTATATGHTGMAPTTATVAKPTTATVAKPTTATVAKPTTATVAKPTTAVADGSGVVPEELAPYTGIVKSIEFKRDQAVMLPSSKRALDKIAAAMIEYKRVALEVGAHTDGRKGPDKSKEITQQQAQVVVDYLIGKGVDANQLSAVGYGMDQPLGDNKTSPGREKNRRIELKFSLK